MSRLYYPPEVRAVSTDSGVRVAANGDQTGGTEWPQKIAKLIPTELVTAYGALCGAILVIEREAWRLPLYLTSFVLCMILTPVYLRKADANNLPKRNHLIVSTIAFPVWAYLVSGNAVLPEHYDAGLATFIAIVFSLITGAIPMDK